MKTLIIFILFLIAVLSSCTTLKNGYNQNFHKASLQKAVVVTYKEYKNDKIYFEGITIPSGLKMSWSEWNLQDRDTLVITDEMFNRARFEY